MRCRRSPAPQRGIRAKGGDKRVPHRFGQRLQRPVFNRHLIKGAIEDVQNGTALFPIGRTVKVDRCVYDQAAKSLSAVSAREGVQDSFSLPIGAVDWTALPHDDDPPVLISIRSGAQRTLRRAQKAVVFAAAILIGARDRIPVGQVRREPRSRAILCMGFSSLVSPRSNSSEGVA